MPASTKNVTADLLRSWPLPRPGGSKYERGHVVVIGGSRRSPGAVVLAGVSALRVGAGRLSLVLPSSVAPGVAVSVPESAVIELPETESGEMTGSALATLSEELGRASAVLIGPGIGDPASALAVLDGVATLMPSDLPVVVDAFALGVLDRSRTAREAFAGRMVLTPNEEEVALLLGRDVDVLSRDIVELASNLGAVVTCFGHVADGSGNNWHVTTASTGVGTSGSGDVLAGSIVGLLARGASMEQAAVWGTWVHAESAARLDVEIGAVGYLASEISAQLPRTLTGFS